MKSDTRKNFVNFFKIELEILQSICDLKASLIYMQDKQRHLAATIRLLEVSGKIRILNNSKKYVK